MKILIRSSQSTSPFFFWWRMAKTAPIKLPSPEKNAPKAAISSGLSCAMPWRASNSRFLHPHEDHVGITCASGATHDLTTVAVVGGAGVTLDGIPREAGALIEDADVVEDAISMPVVADEVARLRVCGRGEAVLLVLRITYHVRHVAVALALSEAG